MKRVLFILILLLLVVFGVIGQEKEIREDMVVINVEVPVRVMHKGKPVDNLKKSDFRLFENGKELPINGFHIVRKKIAGHKIGFESDRKQYYTPRLFVLAFSVTNFNEFYEKGVRYFFDNVLRETDKLLVFVNNNTLSYNDLKDKKNTLNEILTLLNIEGKKARTNIRLAVMSVEGNLRNLLHQLKSPDRKLNYDVIQRNVQSFFNGYYGAWKSYQRSFLNLDIYTMYNFAAFLKRISLEKWVISFYQYEKFPVIDYSTVSGNDIRKYMNSESFRIMGEVQREFNAGRTYPYEEISKIFYNLGAVFNLVVIPSRIETDMEATRMADISTAAEVTLREIAKRTGGDVTFTTDLRKSIEKMVEKDDIQYLLTYVPGEDSTRGRLKVILNQKNYQLLYDDNSRASFVKKKIAEFNELKKMIKFESIRFHEKKLVFNLINFVLLKHKNGESGKLGINIIVKNPEGEILFDRKREISPKYSSTELKIGFSWLKPGKYDLIIDVQDLLTNHKAFEYLKIEVK